MTATLRLRNETPVAHTWALESIFADIAQWEAAIQTLEGQMSELAGFEGRLSSGASAWAAYNELAQDMMVNAIKILVFARLHFSVDTENQEWSARSDQAGGLLSRATATIAFARPELLAVGIDTLRGWLLEDERLAAYGHVLDKLEKQAAHVRSAEVEELLSMAQQPLDASRATHGILANAELTFAPAVSSTGETFAISQGTIAGLAGHADRDVRRSTYEHYTDAHLALKNTMATALAGGIKKDVFLARARHYESSLAAALSATDIPPPVYHNLINTYKANLSTWHRYWAIRRRALGYETLYAYDTRGPLSKSPPVVPYETAVEWIAAGMQPLGEDYVATLRRGCLEDRWVDIYPNKGKRMGAFSSGVAGTRPFIMMSYTDDLLGLSTLAHELGHSMHSYLAWKTQKILPYQQYGLFVAETASNFNQALVRAHLLSQHEDIEFQIAVIEEAMANFNRYFFIMPTLARFELAIHERVEAGHALNADYLIDLMADLFSEGYGDEVEIDRDRLGITWALFHTHLYSNFYVYQYATGISAAHALSARVLQGVPGAGDSYLAFLKAGGSVFPLDALQLAGVDMTSPEPVETTFAVLAGYVDQLEQLIDARERAA